MLRLPSNLSAAPQGAAILDLYDSTRSTLVATISHATSPDVVTLRLDVGARVVARGDVLDPRFRSQLATDVRLCYSSCRADRTALLRLLSDVATAWDDHCQASAGSGGAA